MADFGIGNAIAAGLSYIGGQQQRDFQETQNWNNIFLQQQANLQNMAFAREQTLQGQQFARDESRWGAQFSQEMNNIALAEKEKDREMARDFAQQGIRWRVQDAEAAGIHPIYALGGSGAAYSPSAISLQGAAPASAGTTGAAMAAAQMRGSLPNTLGAMGQDVSRAIMATMAKEDMVKTQMDALQLEKLGLQNDLLRSQIARQLASPGQQGKGDSDGPQSALEVPGHKVKDAEITNPFVVGTTDAQVGETKWGDAAQEVVGIPGFLSWLQAGGSNQFTNWANHTAVTDYLFRVSNDYIRQLEMKDIEGIRPKGRGPISTGRLFTEDYRNSPRNWKGHW